MPTAPSIGVDESTAGAASAAAARAVKPIDIANAVASSAAPCVHVTSDFRAT